ncbi:MAG: heme lyase NrfEFG subunit NrfF [Parashewanella sp.]
MKWLYVCIFMLAIGVIEQVAASPVDTYEFKTEADQVRAIALARTLRCPQCQNQDLVDSNSNVARDLRMRVYKMVEAGKSDDEIIAYMTQRYGEFVLYKPKVENKTYILWLGPFVLLIIGGIIGALFIRQQRTQKSNSVELDESEQQQIAELLKVEQQKQSNSK